MGSVSSEAQVPWRAAQGKAAGRGAWKGSQKAIRKGRMGMTKRKGLTPLEELKSLPDHASFGNTATIS